ncbi:hypothetical protein MJM99_34025, partial [Salmonella enterica subsp. enterica serovar Kentucky]|nr:hypothetical protein [Salmonella enterica subsp. enterica serovar Kentucky]
HPLIVSTTLNTEVSQRLQSLLPDIFSHCQIRLTDESELFLRLRRRLTNASPAGEGRVIRILMRASRRYKLPSESRARRFPVVPL